MKHVALALLVLAACTSHDDSETLPDATRTFTPSQTTFVRFAAQCGVQAPPFTSADLYSFSLIGAPAVNQTLINVSFHPTLPAEQDLPVDLQQFGVLSFEIDSQGNMTDEVFGQDGSLPLTDNTFEWSQGTNASELDDQPLNDATIEIISMPADNGDLGVLSIRMVFADGGIYDQVVNAPLTTPLEGCPAG